jgi:hypothetical protein
MAHLDVRRQGRFFQNDWTWRFGAGANERRPAGHNA